MKTPQSNVNLAAKYSLLAQHLLASMQMLLEPKKVISSEKMVLDALSDELLGAIMATKEFTRKVSPIELVGNRG
jgi:hypothetical protein